MIIEGQPVGVFYATAMARCGISPGGMGAVASGVDLDVVCASAPHGALYLAGDGLSYLSGWMAGALGSARTVARRVHERASREMGAVTARA